MKRKKNKCGNKIGTNEQQQQQQHAETATATLVASICITRGGVGCDLNVGLNGELLSSPMNEPAEKTSPTNNDDGIFLETECFYLLLRFGVSVTGEFMVPIILFC